MRSEDEARRQTVSEYEGDTAPPHTADKPATQPVTAKAEEPVKAPDAPRPIRRYILLGLLGVALVVVATYGYSWWTVGRHLVSTEDAYIHADFSILSPRISGNIASVPVVQNQHVSAGTPLVVLDNVDYQLALSSAEARISSQQAALDRLDRQIKASDAAVDQAVAQKASTDADLVQARADYARYETLAASDFTSKQKLETSRGDRDRATAAVAQAMAGIAVAEANRDVVRAQRIEGEQSLRELGFARDRARRDLDATILRAPFDGVVGNVAVAVGDYVTAGKRLLAVVPLDAVYIDANFKETQIGDLKPGTPVEIEVDAYPGRAIRGEIASVAPASGAVFSLLPPENATGNFTKVVQRVPVRVRVPAEVAAEGLLRPGLSVVVTADPLGVSEISTAARQ